MVGERGEFVVCDEVARNGLAVIRAEELRRGVPQLAGVAGGYGVERVFELDIATGEQGVEVELVV